MIKETESSNELSRINSMLISDKFDYFVIGGINYNTPFNDFLKNKCSSSIHNYLYHQEVCFYGDKNKYLIIILSDKLIISNYFNPKQENENILITFLNTYDYKSVNND
jgi:hypothetical protein